MFSLRRLTMERAATLIVFLLLFGVAARFQVDTDVWWHLRAAEHTLTQGMIRGDPFSFTRTGETWTNHSWLSQIIIYGFWRLAGDLGLALFTGLMATIGMVFIWRMSSGNVYLRAFALVLGAITAAVFWSPRPQMFSFVLSTVLLYVLWRYRNGRGLWLIVPIMALWGNLHAGYSIGFILLAGTIAGEALNTLTGVEGAIGWRGVGKLILITTVSAAALVINPYGVDILRVPFETVSIGALQAFIVEWQSPDFHNRQMWPFAAMILAIIGAAGASKRRFNWTDFLLVAGTAFLSFNAARNIATFAVVTTPILTQHLDALLTERGWTFNPVKFVSPRIGLLNAALVVIIGLAGVLQVFGGTLPQITRVEYQRSLPVLAAEFIDAERPVGPMFNSYNWGGYLMYSLPDYPVFVDGRTDLYGDFLNIYYNTTNGGDGWRETLDEYGVNLVVVETSGGLARNLRAESGWRLAYEDDLAAVFVREGA